MKTKTDDKHDEAQDGGAARDCLPRLVEWFRGHGQRCKLRYDASVGDYVVVDEPKFRVRPFVAWYDFWVGVFVDRKQRQIYIFPLPMIGLQIGYQSSLNNKHTDASR